MAAAANVNIVTSSGKLKWSEFIKIKGNPDPFISKLTHETVNEEFDVKPFTPLIGLFEYGVVNHNIRHEFVADLIQKGANVDLGNPLKLAIEHHDIESAKLLINEGAQYVDGAAALIDEMKGSPFSYARTFAEELDAYYKTKKQGSSGGRRKHSTRHHQRRTRRNKRKNRQTRRKK